MRGHSSIQLATCSPNNTGHPAFPARKRGAVIAALALLGTLGGGACDSGYYGGGQWQSDSVNYTGRMAMSWTVNGKPLTTALCQSDRIDSMAVTVLSDLDGQSSVEFINVVCDLSIYSLTMVPTGPVSLYVDAIHVQKDQSQCVRFAGMAHSTATTQFPQNPVPIDLKTVATCP